MATVNALVFFDLQVGENIFATAVRKILLTAFTSQELPQPLVDQELLSNLGAADMQQDRHAELITYLDLAMVPEKGETAVDDFR